MRAIASSTRNRLWTLGLVYLVDMRFNPSTRVGEALAG